MTAQLIDVRSSQSEWAQTFEEPLTDLFALQDAISARVAGRLASALTPEERRALSRRHTGNLQAYDLYLRGRFFWEKRTDAHLRTAIDYFTQAVQLDEGFALAYAGLAHCYCVLASSGAVPRQEVLEPLRSAASRALALDDRLAEAYTAMAVLHAHEWNSSAQEAAFKRAIDVDPQYPTSYLWYGYMLDTYGRRQESLTMRRRAYDLDPLNLQINVDLADILYKNGRHDEALQQIARAMELDPEYADAHHTLGLFHLDRGRYGEAIAAFTKARRLAPLAHAHAISGEREAALDVLRQLAAERAERYVTPLDFAMVHAGLRENDRAFEWLERAFSDRLLGVKRLEADPWYAPLRGDPRYPDLVRRVQAAMR